MQAIAPDSAQSTPQEQDQLTAQTGVLVVTLEFMLYAVLILVTVLFRVAELDSVPMIPGETGQALSTYRIVIPEASGETIDIQSPIVFLAQSIGMTIFGGNEFASRLFTALAGVILILSPLLFREQLGRTRAFVIALLLAFSPVLFSASRFSSGMIWALLFCALTLWALQKFWNLRRDQSEHASSYGVIAMVGFAGMVLLSDPGGLVLGLIVIGALITASYFTVMENPDDNEEFVRADRFNWSNLIQGFPWTTGLLASVITLIVISTIFMMYPSGLAEVGGVVNDFLAGFTQPAPDTPLFYPLVTAIFYEPWLWILAGIAIVLIYQRIAFTFIERFFVAWLVAGVLASLIFQGGMAEHAVWLIIPLIGLASYLITDALNDDDSPTLWLGDFLDDSRLVASSAYWGKWVLALAISLLFVVLAVHFEMIARGFLQVPDGSLGGLFSRLGDSTFSLVTNSIIWLLIGLLFTSVAYFMGASIWGNTTTLRSIILGGTLFLLVSGMGTGWNIAVARATSPTELWHPVATSQNALTLRSVLRDFSLRETQGEPALFVTVLAEDDGLLAWLLRDYRNTTYIDTVESAHLDPIVILPPVEADEAPIDLGASYVGQDFTITEDWRLGNIGLDFLTWWATRDVRFDPFPTQEVVLWVRQDVYDSVPYVPPSAEDPNSRG